MCTGPWTANAGVGEPTGTFALKVQHGATTIVDTIVAVPADIKLSDNTPEGFVQVGSVGSSPIILKMVSDDDPDFRIVHFFLNVPVSTEDIYAASSDSLLDPSNSATINVSISDLEFTDTTEVTPLLVNNNTFLTAFMRDNHLGSGGRFYSLPNSNFYGPGMLGPFAQAQVPGSFFFDGDASMYGFTGSFAQPRATWSWLALPNPGPLGVPAINIDGTISPGDGMVFELGLSVAFVGVPEPGTLAFLLPGMLAMLARRRR